MFIGIVLLSIGNFWSDVGDSKGVISRSAK